MSLDPRAYSRIMLVALAIALVVQCGGGGGGGDGGPTGPPPPSTRTITTSTSPPPRFNPANTTLAAGGTVTWTNTSPDPVEHDLLSSSSNWQLIGDLPQGGSFSTTIAQPGTYDYICTIHVNEGMTGRIVVQ